AGRYQVALKDQRGCTYEFSVRIGMNTDLFVPNVFTPNNDGYNDTFFIRNLPPSGVKLIISNRWGNKVFSSDNYQNEWDAEGVEDGIYFYYLVTPDREGTGWVEIQRGVKPGG
ncbi:MAG: gliding motility-associated C-terminal domain-containing protein, partial [Cyclobacteriaceae bacterium]|nr:gliding motility-associated C-terminal domain-containing protein [Cyclobacteriaceae bacterium]